MISFPHAKINLGLRVLDQRPDGFHNISSIFIPIQLRDCLEFIPGGDDFRLHPSGRHIQANKTDNLVFKAAKLVQEKSGIPGGDIYLHKNIPMGSGLGGGSADAAFMFNLLNKTFELGLSEEIRMGYAAQLGSDCAFFIQDKVCLAEGRGEILSRIPSKGKDYHIIILKPRIHISTAEAYKSVQKNNINKAGLSTESLSLPEPEWQKVFKNDFEPWACQEHPIIEDLINLLKHDGAFYAAMSGSGSSVYGLFTDTPNITHDDPEVFFWQGKISI